jgi:putative colanic acid biosynthesis acetyltransferase WcaF
MHLWFSFWWIVQGAFFRMSPQFLYGFRKFLLHLFGVNTGY